MEKNPFLQKKYPDLAGSKPVESAVKKARGGGKKIHDNPERIEAYMERLENITENERGFGKLRSMILDRFTVDTRDEDVLDKIAKGLYESEKRIAIEMGHGGRNIERLGSDADVVRKYKPLILEKAEIQRKTLGSWLDYLQKNDAKHPMWFRYFVVRNLEKMGIFDKENAGYSKRTGATVAPFPELNSEALGWVFKRLDEGDDPDEEDEEKKKRIERLIQSKDFSKLYAYAQIETAGKLNRESIEGAWKKYDKGSDFRLLEHDLKGKGTGWCTAEGSAEGHLKGGDFYAYYSKGSSGAYSEPRVAIRMEGGRVAEVRGVNPKQGVEPELVDIAHERYHDLPGGESYDKKAKDMKEMTRLVKLQEQGKPFSKNDLRFLYEMDAEIEGFGYPEGGKCSDPRIKELRDQRNPKEDAPIVFECRSNEIAWKKEEVTKTTKAYVGPLFEGIFKTLGHLEHLYTSFPEGKITRQTIEIGGKTEKQLEQAIEQAGYRIHDYAKQMMQSKVFTTEKQAEQTDLVRLKVRDLFNDARAHTTDQIYKKAEELGLELCPAEVGPHLRLKLTDQPMGELLRIAMKQIPVADGYPRVFDVERDGDGTWLYSNLAEPTNLWNPDDEIVFRLRK